MQFENIEILQKVFDPMGKTGGGGSPNNRYFDVPLWLGCILGLIVLIIIVGVILNKKPKKDEWEDKREDY